MGGGVAAPSLTFNFSPLSFAFPFPFFLKAMIKVAAVPLLLLGLLYFWSAPTGINLRKERGKLQLLTDRFSPEKVPKDVDYVIIGAGMSGLSCAAILAR